MGSKGREIIGMDVEVLLDLLRRAYCDEWLAYYQYWLGAKLVKGPMKDAVGAELLQHSTEELLHGDAGIGHRSVQAGRGVDRENPVGFLEGELLHFPQ